MTFCWKVLRGNGEPCHGGTGRWSLPNGKPGDWMPKIDRLVPCESGYHVCDTVQLLEWLGPTVWVAETRGRIVDSGNKSVVGEARLIRQANWDDRIARLFAADCAEEVVKLIPPTRREVAAHAISTARAFANGHATYDELAAARAAAWGAAEAAASAAARAAARAAAWSAARDAARDAARVRQANCLYPYLTGELS